MSAALESVSEVFLKRNGTRSQSVTFVLQHLVLILRHKSEMAKALVAEGICTPGSFQWRTQLQYSPETEDLYTLPEKTHTTRRQTLGPDYGLISSTHSTSGSRHMVTPLKSRSPGPGAGTRNSQGLVASSRSLLNSKNALLAATASGDNYSEFSRSAASIGVQSIGGCSPPLKCFVHCHMTILPYGFEFLGSGTYLTLTPQTERSLLSLVNAMACHACTSIDSAACFPGKTTAGRDVAVVSQYGIHLAVPFSYCAYRVCPN